MAPRSPLPTSIVSPRPGCATPVSTRRRMCSTTRASMHTGRNHHAVGMGCLSNFDSGFPGYRGKIARNAPLLLRTPPAARLPQLHGRQVALHAVDPQTGPTGPFDGWPLGRGFDPLLTDSSTPRPISTRPNWSATTHTSTAPGNHASGYHLTEDLVDNAIGYVTSHLAATPDDPWYMLLAPGACHAPHQAPVELIDHYSDIFAKGWDQARADRLAAQVKLGIVPGDTVLPDRKPRCAALGGALQRRAPPVCATRWRIRRDARPLRTSTSDGCSTRLEQTGMLDDTIVMVMSRQWRQPGRRPTRLRQRDGPFQHGARIDRGQDRANRRHRWTRHAFELSSRLGNGGQHAIEAVQAEHPQRWGSATRSLSPLLNAILRRSQAGSLRHQFLSRQ